MSRLNLLQRCLHLAELCAFVSSLSVVSQCRLAVKHVSYWRHQTKLLTEFLLVFSRGSYNYLLLLLSSDLWPSCCESWPIYVHLPDSSGLCGNVVRKQWKASWTRRNFRFLPAVQKLSTSAMLLSGTCRVQSLVVSLSWVKQGILLLGSEKWSLSSELCDCCSFLLKKEIYTHSEHAVTKWRYKDVSVFEEQPIKNYTILVITHHMGQGIMLNTVRESQRISFLTLSGNSAVGVVQCTLVFISLSLLCLSDWGTLLAGVFGVLKAHPCVVPITCNPSPSQLHFSRTKQR